MSRTEKLVLVLGGGVFLCFGVVAWDSHVITVEARRRLARHDRFVEEYELAHRAGLFDE